MSVTVRPLHIDEIRTFLDIHVRSVRGLAVGHYSLDVIAAWAMPPTDDNVERLLRNEDEEIRLIAELHGEPVGLGVLVVASAELRACDVVPEAARKGIGSAVVRELEAIARANGLTRLDLHASLNAEPFYSSLGYTVIERGEHNLCNGERMAAVRMRKVFG